MSEPLAADPERLGRINALLEAALALPADERHGWLRTLPPEQQSFVPLLGAMLDRASVETDTFMLASCGNATSSGVASSRQRASQASDSSVSTSSRVSSASTFQRGRLA